jgi:hypothetical protein
MASPAPREEPAPTSGKKVDAVTVANAAGTVIARTLGGTGLGLLVGITVFIVQKQAGWLERGGWTGAVLWGLLPVYILAGGAALGYSGFWSGIRGAARAVLLETGALRRTVDRMLARARKSADGPDAGDDEPPSRGWVGARIAAIGKRIARVIVDRLGAAAAPGAETGAQVDRIAAELIDDVGFVPTIIVLVVLAATFAVAPLALA